MSPWKINALERKAVFIVNSCSFATKFLIRVTIRPVFLLTVIVFYFFYNSSFAQNIPEQASITIKRTKESITIDGILDENAWKNADKAKDWYLSFPVDTAFANSQTEAMLIFDNEYLYIGFICHDPIGGDYIVQSLRRDFEWSVTENVSVYLDTFNDKINGFTFGLSPLGVQREGLISDGEEISADWDNKWFTAVKNYEDKWTAEFKIPFKTLRYKDNNKLWNINFIRNDLKRNERSSWTAVPQQYRTNNLSFAGKLHWEEPPPKAGSNISIIPYISGGVSRNHQDDESTEFRGDVGFDAKVAVTSSINLDLTVNPDFSQVEVDQQVTNLDRFEIFFPEKRQFFLENNDLFGQNGFRRSRPFFSRRIGIAKDTAGHNIQIPIRYGLRLSGKLDRNWRVGLLNMQTARESGAELSGIETIEGSHKLPSQNYTVAVFQRRIFSRSNIGALLVNRQATNYNDLDTTISTTKYNRIIGLDYNLGTNNNRWEGNSYYHRSLDPGINKKNYSFGAFLKYASRNFTVMINAQEIAENFNAELGFVPRKGVKTSFNRYEFTFYPKNSIVATHGPIYRMSFVTDKDYNLTDRGLQLGYKISFKNGRELEVEINQEFQKLRNDFNPIDPKGDSVLLTGESFNWRNFQIEFNSDNRKILSYQATAQIGSYYTGHRTNITGTITYRIQPIGLLNLNIDYNHINLPFPLKEVDFFLIGPRFDLTFTDKLFLTTFVQYNSQDDNLNINTRFQWRFKPVSDLFIVYTDNYFPEQLKVKNRALVLKLSYWFNL